MTEKAPTEPEIDRYFVEKTTCCSLIKKATKCFFVDCLYECCLHECIWNCCCHCKYCAIGGCSASKAMPEMKKGAMPTGARPPLEQ